MKADRASHGTGRDVVGPAECRDEIVESVLVSHINDLEASAPFIPVGVE
jgi:hypothetical protein